MKQLKLTPTQQWILKQSGGGGQNPQVINRKSNWETKNDLENEEESDNLEKEGIN